MKFLKRNLKVVVAFVIGLVLTSGITVYATVTYMINAENVMYKDDKTIEYALNDLYNNKKETSNEVININTNGEQELEKYYKNINVNVVNPVNITLLWTNSNPNGAFAAQTISLNLSSYTAVLIDTTYGYNGLSSSDCLKQRTYVNVGTSSVVTGTQSAKYATTLREVTVSTSGVTFSTGKFYNGSNVSSNNWAVPLHIWGVK